MLFSGTVFLLLFLPLLLLVYFVIPNRYLSVRNVVLIVFSLIFYSFGGMKQELFVEIKYLIINPILINLFIYQMESKLLMEKKLMNQQ